MKTRKAKPKHTTWNPHPYQKRAVEHLIQTPVAALWLDPGLGKTSVTLEAFRQLKAAGRARKMLVIAPLRVCQLVWRQEADQWTQFRDLKFSLLHGTPKQKEKALADDADIYLINPEGIAWLVKQFGGGFTRVRRRWDFDTVTIDELTKFKNSQAKRHKLLRPYIAKAQRRWGLTGTPIPNGYMDLFGQFLILDGGAALGRYITHFRDQYFNVGFDGFSYDLRAGAAAKIEERIRPYVLRMDAEDYLCMPALIPDPIEIELDKKTWTAYQALRKDCIADLGADGVVVAENAGGVYTKLKQLANGAVYLPTDGGGRKAVNLHELKLDALEDLIEGLGGQQLMVAYEFNHDLERLRERLGQDVPYLGSGVSGKKAQEIERAWNAGEIQVLLVHPASAGHGLNFQKGGAGHICWFSVTLDYELYDQLIRRLFRQGNPALRIVNHAIIVRNTVDELSLDIIDGKAVNQARLLKSLNSEVITADQGDDPMGVRKLSRKSEVEETEDEAPRRRRRAAAAEPEDDEDEEDEPEAPPRRRKPQRERVRERLAGDDDEEDGEDDEDEADEKPGFSKGVRRRLQEDDEEEDDSEDEEEQEPAPKRTRSVRKSRPEPDRPDDDAEDSDDEPPFEADTSHAFPGLIGGNAFDVSESRRIEALNLVARFAEPLRIKSATEATKAAEAFEKYLAG